MKSVYFSEAVFFLTKYVRSLPRDKDERRVFLSGSLLTRKNRRLESWKDWKSDTYLREGF